MKTNFTKSLALGILCLPFANVVNAQSASINFDDVVIPEGFSALSKSMETTEDEGVAYTFTSTGVVFSGYQATWGNYSGFDCSRGVDSLDDTYSNDYSAIAAIGYDESEQYAVAYVTQRFPDFPENTNPIGIKLDADSTQELVGAYFTNTTLTYRYIQGNLSNMTSYKMIVKGYVDGTRVSDSVVLDLANISATDTMIVRDWTFASFEPLGAVDSITFELYSDDITTYTPFYFAVDEIVIKDVPPTSIDLSSTNELNVILAPNPASDYLDVLVDDSEQLQFQIYNIQGQLMQYGNLQQSRISLYHLSSGNYFIHLFDKHSKKKSTLKFVKQ